MPTWKKVLLTLGLIAAAISTALGGYGSRESIRLVDFLRIFAGGFLLGVTLLGALRRPRVEAPASPTPPAPPTVPATNPPPPPPVSKSGA